MHTSTYSEYLLICPNSFSQEYGGLTSLGDELDMHWYLYIILVLGDCGGLKGLVDLKR